MKKVSIEDLNARMLEYFDEVERTGEPLLVTDRGRQILEVRPIQAKTMKAAEVLAEYRRDRTSVAEVPEEELMRPLPGEDWEVLREDDRNPW